MSKNKVRFCSLLTAVFLMCQPVTLTAFADSTNADGINGEISSNAQNATNSSVNFDDTAVLEDVTPVMSVDSEKAYDLTDYENNEVLISYKDGTIAAEKYDSQEELKAALDKLSADENVSMLQPNFSYEGEAVTAQAAAAVRNDVYYSRQWALNNDGSFTGITEKVSPVKGVDINVDEAWANYTPRRNVTIAIVDTGVDYTNTELSDSMWVNTDEIPGNGIDDDKNGYIDDVYGWNFYNGNNVMYSGSSDDHGTHCAGTITASGNNKVGISGIADYSNIKIMPVKSLGGRDGEGSTLSVILGIKYAEANGADICNLSLGTSISDPMLYNVIASSKMLFVIAGGNSSSVRTANTDVYPSYPASYNLDNIISVANINAAGVIDSSSAYGAKTVDLAAPGTDIISTVSNKKYSYMTGTSMAAPMVTAVAALVYSGSSNITLANTKDIILNTVTTSTSLSGKTVTGGMLDAGKAVSFNTANTVQRTWTKPSAAGTSSQTNTNTGNTGNSGNYQTPGWWTTPVGGTNPGYGTSPRYGYIVQIPSWFFW